MKKAHTLTSKAFWILCLINMLVRTFEIWYIFSNGCYIFLAITESISSLCLLYCKINIQKFKYFVIIMLAVKACG